jgi:nucleoid DNA-binding protein
MSDKPESKSLPNRTLTKQELARAVADQMGFSIRSSRRLVNCLFEKMKQELRSGRQIKVVRFGTFKPVCKKARKGINPHTGEEIQIPARKSVSFKPSALLKKRINAEKGQKILPNRGGEPDHRG